MFGTHNFNGACRPRYAKDIFTSERGSMLLQHLADEELRDEGRKLWTGLWHATIPKDFLIVASQKCFSVSVCSVYAYITTRMDLESGKSGILKNSDVGVWFDPLLRDPGFVLP